MDNNNYNYNQYPGYPPQSPQNNNGNNNKLLLIVIALLLVVVICLLIILIMNFSGKSDKDSSTATEATTGVTTTEPTKNETTSTEEITTEKTTEATTTEATTTEATSTEATTTEAQKTISKGDVISAIHDAVKKQSGYVDNGSDKGVMGDWNEDGYDDLLMVYILKDDNGMFKEVFDLYTIYPDGYERLISGVTYEQVGGNSGSVGITRRREDGTIYVAVQTDGWQGEKYDAYITYYPWRKGELYPDTKDGFFYFEKHGHVDDTAPDGIEYDYCVVGDQKVDYDTYLNKDNFENETRRFNTYTKPSAGKIDLIEDLISDNK